MQEIIYKITPEDTVLGGQNCWDNVEPLDDQTEPYNSSHIKEKFINT
jgi:hypothetical protein